jgi:hypothetical protein
MHTKSVSKNVFINKSWFFPFVFFSLEYTGKFLTVNQKNLPTNSSHGLQKTTAML